MYLDLTEHYRAFEKRVSDFTRYLNTEDCQIYSPEERQESIGSEVYDASAFLLVPQMDIAEIADKYLVSLNNLPLMRKIKGSKDPMHSFWNLVDSYDYQERCEWLAFEKQELMNFAAAWCKENGVSFSTKERPAQDDEPDVWH